MDWTETTLWSSLSQKTGPEVQSVQAVLNRWMPKIQMILETAGTAPTAFTLHDASHSFRVAQRMSEIVPSDVLPHLASYELALLLLSASLHDIGMTPEQRKVALHYEYLLAGPRNGPTTAAHPELSEQEIELFQRWLDDDERGLVPPSVKGSPNAEDLLLANELVTYYCRHRHNDWSDDWIRKNLGTETLGTYDGWLDDLVRLCRSHHQGKTALLNEVFNPGPWECLPLLFTCATWPACSV